MATIDAGGRLLISRASGTRDYTLGTGASQRDKAAGSEWTYSVELSTNGLGPAGAPDTLTATVRTLDGTLLRTIPLNTTATTQTFTFRGTSNADTGGALRAGTLLVDLQAVKTTGGPTETYNVDTFREGTGNTGTFTFTTDRGLVRSTTTATVAVEAPAGTTRALLAYPDSPVTRVTTAVPLYGGTTFQTAYGPRSVQVSVLSGQSTATGSLGTVNTGFPAALTTYTPTVSAFTLGPTNIPVVGLTSTTGTAQQVDPRLTRTPLFQLDDNTFATPPLSKDKPHQRLTSQQGFLGSRTTNARGEGINDLVYDIALTPRKPGSPVSNTGLTTATRGTEAGWSPVLTPWSSSLPGGIWDKTVTIKTPSGYTGAYVVQNGSTEYRLIAKDPNTEVRANVQHEPGLAGRHFVAGMTLIPSAYLIDVSTNVRYLAASAGFARVSLVRASAAANSDGTGVRWEYLGPGETWVPWTDPAMAQHTFPMNVSVADATTFERRFTSNATWGERDVRVNIQLEYEGVIYSTTYIVVNVGTANQHDRYEFDGAGFLGLGGAK